MSEDKRKNLRTQGRFSSEAKDKPLTKEDKQKKNVTKSYSKERLRRNSPDMNSDLKSDSPKSSSVELMPRNENMDTVIKYEENSIYAASFSQLRSKKMADEINEPGITVLSVTENGESRVLFKPDFIETEQANKYHDMFKDSTNWCEKTLYIRGIEVLQPRLVAWYGPFPYEYSGVTLEPREMTPALLHIKRNIESFLREHGIEIELNSVLLNYYRTEKDSVAWHSDDELSMGVCPTIASVSFGETRKFQLRRKQTLNEDGMERPKDDADHVIHLKNGSLIVMDGVMQKDWQHRVPKEYHNKDSRINLTFRTVYAINDVNRHPLQEKYSIRYPKYSEVTSAYEVKQELTEDLFPPLNVTIKSPVSSTEMLSHIDYKTTLVEKEECQLSLNKLNGLLKNETSNSGGEKSEINACSSSLLYSPNEFDENVLAPPIPAPVAQSFSNPNWPLNAINAPAFTSQNFGFQQVESSTMYNTMFMEKEGITHSQVLNQYVSDGCNQDVYNQDNPNLENLQSEQYMDPGNCLEIANWYLTTPFQDTDSEEISKYLELFKNIPFTNYTEEMHLTKRDNEELKILCTVAEEAAALSDHCRNSVLARMCTVISKAEFFWNRDLQRGYDKNNFRSYERRNKPVRTNRFNQQNKY